MKSLSLHIRLLTLMALLASTLVVCGLTAHAQEEEEEETTALVASGVEVRIGAQRHDDGRTEFALQVREDDSWSELVLPRSRFFPTTARVDRWLNSSVLELESAHTVRISAKLLEDDRIEFALQQRIGNEWVDRLLPRPRFFPTNARIGRWLYSGRVEPVGYVPIQSVSAAVGGATPFSLWFEFAGGDGYTSGVEVQTQADGHGTEASNGRVLFMIRCDVFPGTTGELVLRATALQRLSGARSTISVTYRIDDAEPVQEEWIVRGALHNQYGVNVSSQDSQTLFKDLRSASSFRLQIAGSPDVDVTFDITDLYNTAMQENFDQCGNYLPQPWPDRFPE